MASGKKFHLTDAHKILSESLIHVNSMAEGLRTLALKPDAVGSNLGFATSKISDFGKVT